MSSKPGAGQTLYTIRKHLELKTSADDLRTLRMLLATIYELPKYVEWLSSDQFYESTDPRSRFQIEPSFGKGLQEKKWLLERFGLLNGDILTVKIDKHQGRIHITDGNWVPAQYRVYPFADESEHIVDFVRLHGFDKTSSILIDPACGCGHHALGLSNIPIKINLDINPRALEFARVNCLLADLENIFCAESDIYHGLPKHLEFIATDQMLLAVNMPFGIFPKLRNSGDQTKVAQDGGERGIELTEKAIHAISTYKKNGGKTPIVSVILCYSLGDPNNNLWDVLNIAKRYMPNEDLSFTLLEDRLWRVSGRKEQPNPMPIDNLALKAGCIHTDLLPNLPPFISRLCSSFAPHRSVLRTQLV